MYIESIKIKKFRHIENVEIGSFSFNNRTSDLIVLAGPNGSGKSSVLELIGYALSSSYSLSWQLSRTFNGFSFEIGVGLSNEERKIVSDALKSELEPQENKLQESLDQIGLKTNLEETLKSAQKEQLREQLRRSAKHQYDIIDYLKTNNIYYRAFDYYEGEYEKNATLHNQIHYYTSRELKDLNVLLVFSFGLIEITLRKVLTKIKYSHLIML